MVSPLGVSPTNGLQFVQLPPELTAPIVVRIESDAPLPKAPHLKLHSLDEDRTLGLGSAEDAWLYPYFSSDLLFPVPFKGDSCLVFHSGTIDVPVFASSQQRVYAEFKYEYQQEDAVFKNKAQTMTIDGGGHQVTVRLPGARRMASTILDLGLGSGALKMTPIHFETSLPSHADQRKAILAGDVEKYAFIKLYSIKLFHMSSEMSDGLTIDVGRNRDQLYLDRGFFDSERGGSGRVRWTHSEVVFRLPMARPAVAYNVEITSIPIRPDSETLRPSFTFNTWTVPADFVNIQVGEKRISYSFQVPAEVVNPDQADDLSIRVAPWRPSESGSSDSRELGIMIDTLDLQAVEGN